MKFSRAPIRMTGGLAPDVWPGLWSNAAAVTGALGLMTTHDLALARLAEELQP